MRKYRRFTIPLLVIVMFLILLFDKKEKWVWVDEDRKNSVVFTDASVSTAIYTIAIPEDGEDFTYVLEEHFYEVVDRFYNPRKNGISMYVLSENNRYYLLPVVQYTPDSMGIDIQTVNYAFRDYDSLQRFLNEPMKMKIPQRDTIIKARQADFIMSASLAGKIFVKE